MNLIFLNSIMNDKTNLIMTPIQSNYKTIGILYISRWWLWKIAHKHKRFSKRSLIIAHSDIQEKETTTNSAEQVTNWNWGLNRQRTEEPMNKTHLNRANDQLETIETNRERTEKDWPSKQTKKLKHEQIKKHTWNVTCYERPAVTGTWITSLKRDVENK